VQSPRLSKDDVAEAALDILDRLGLPDLTMRRLAAALDVQASALYWHFPNKQTLLADLADRIVRRRAPATTSGDWDERLSAEAFGIRDALLAYRDSAEIVSSSLALGLGDNQPSPGCATPSTRVASTPIPAAVPPPPCCTSWSGTSPWSNSADSTTTSASSPAPPPTSTPRSPRATSASG
jgi:AcrR family transcriptional regulator